MDEEKVIAPEICLAYHIVKHHQSFRSAACLNKLVLKLFNDSNTARKYSSAATKTAALIKQVLAPHSNEIIKKDIENSSFYSIATDASNHKAEKMFPLVIQYFTISGIKIKLLRLGNLKGGTSDIVSNYCIETLQHNNNNLEKCVAFSGDNANVNFGGRERRGKNNIFTKLKTAIGTDIEGIGCPAHVLHNTMQTSIVLRH